MSNLHKRLIKHRHMTSEEKKNCKCEMCTGLNVNKQKVSLQKPEEVF